MFLFLLIQPYTITPPPKKKKINKKAQTLLPQVWTHSIPCQRGFSFSAAASASTDNLLRAQWDLFDSPEEMRPSLSPPKRRELWGARWRSNLFTIAWWRMEMKKSVGGATLGGWGHSFQALFMYEDELLSNLNTGSSLSPQDPFIQRFLGSKDAVYWKLCLDKIFLLCAGLCFIYRKVPAFSQIWSHTPTHVHTLTGNLTLGTVFI